MQRQYVAIDLHRWRSVIVREDEAGQELGVTRIDNSPLALSEAVGAAGPWPQVAIEATAGWYWAVDVLHELGAQVHLVNPSGLAWGDRRVKNDYRDCCDLIEADAAGQAPGGLDRPAGDPGAAGAGALATSSCSCAPASRPRSKAVVTKHGLRPPVNDLWGPGGTAYLDSLELADVYHIKVESLRDLVEHADREIEILERVIHRRLVDDPGYQAIQAIHGVGQVLAAVFVAEIGDVSRFPTPGSLCSWAGLTPRHRESDTKLQRGHITKAGSTLVRWAAVEAISRIRGGPKLQADYHRIADRRGRATSPGWRWPASCSSSSISVCETERSAV